MNVEKLIHETCKIITEADDLSEYQSGDEFENYVYHIMNSISSELTVEQTGKQTFPDIVINGSYGVEVKFSKNKNWQSVGNSIFEGTLKSNVTDQIYLVFGQMNGNRINVRYKKYEDVLEDVKVTHSPRFFINMDMQKENSILHKINMTYDEFKVLDSTDKSNRIKEFVRSNLRESEDLWRLDSNESEDMVPKIVQFNSLTTEEKNNKIAECMVLFPEIFIEGNKNYKKGFPKYRRTVSYLLTKYQLVSPSMRDEFSAGGTSEILIDGHEYNLSKVLMLLNKNAILIKEKLQELDIGLLCESWGVQKPVTGDEIESIWLKEINKYGYRKCMNNSIKPEDVYKNGLI